MTRKPLSVQNGIAPKRGKVRPMGKQAGFVKRWQAKAFINPYRAT